MRKNLILILFLLLRPAVSYAGHITIVGSPQLSVTGDGKQISIKGEISLQNKGDEKAIEVFPMLQINSWSWAGEPSELEASGQNSWTIAEDIPIELISSSPDFPGGDFKLPVRGAHPLYLLRYYRDLNGYQFSSPGIQRIIIGQISSREQSELRIPSFQGRMSFGEGSQRFHGTLTIRNLSGKDRDVLLSFHTSQNLEIESEPSLIYIPAKKTKEMPVAVKNFSGLVGSHYGVYAILQWKQGELRNTYSVASSVSIGEEKRRNWFLYGAGVSLVLGVVVVRVFLMQNKKK